KFAGNDCFSRFEFAGNANPAMCFQEKIQRADFSKLSALHQGSADGRRHLACPGLHDEPAQRRRFRENFVNFEAATRGNRTNYCAIKDGQTAVCGETSVFLLFLNENSDYGNRRVRREKFGGVSARART
ncbi:MAG: hypothetical protein ACI4P3_05260, partial [Candidatus Spyradosoma sp.]